MLARAKYLLFLFILFSTVSCNFDTSGKKPADDNAVTNHSEKKPGNNESDEEVSDYSKGAAALSEGIFSAQTDNGSSSGSSFVIQKFINDNGTVLSELQIAADCDNNPVQGSGRYVFQGFEASNGIIIEGTLDFYQVYLDRGLVVNNVVNGTLSITGSDIESYVAEERYVLSISDDGVKYHGYSRIGDRYYSYYPDGTLGIESSDTAPQLDLPVPNDGEVCTNDNAGINNGNNTTNQTSYSISGSVSGLKLPINIVFMNENKELTVDGNFTFTTKLVANFPYNTYVAKQSPGQTCTIQNGIGKMPASDVNNITITCTNEEYRVKVDVGSALNGPMVLQFNEYEKTISESGTFYFDQKILNGTAYTLSVKNQPPGQTCSISTIFATGTVKGADINNSISCYGNSYTVGGNLSGLTSSVTLKTISPNGYREIALSNNETFNFEGTWTYGEKYDVFVTSQPEGQTCIITNANGTIEDADIANVNVECLNGIIPVVQETKTLTWTNTPEGQNKTVTSGDIVDPVTTITFVDSPVRFSSETGFYPNIQYYNSKFYLIYDHDEDGSIGMGNIARLAVSSDGKIWTINDINYTDMGTSYCQAPSMTMNETGFIYVICNGTKLIKSTDDGLTWTTQYIFDNAYGRTASSVIAINSDIYIASVVTITGNSLPSLYFIHSADGGLTWDKKTEIVTSGINSDPVLKIANGEYHIVYTDDSTGSLMLTKSNDGVTWSKTTIAEIHQSLSNQMVINATNIGVASGNKYFISTDNGVTWTNGEIIDPEYVDMAAMSIFPAGSKLYMSYIDIKNTNLKLAESSDNGNTWSVKTIEENSFGHFDAHKTSLWIEGTNIYVSYKSSVELGLMFLKSGDLGQTWNTQVHTLPVTGKIIDDTPESGTYSKLVAKDTDLYVAYVGADDYYSGISIARSVDDGATWSHATFTEGSQWQQLVDFKYDGAMQELIIIYDLGTASTIRQRFLIARSKDGTEWRVDSIPDIGELYIDNLSYYMPYINTDPVTKVSSLMMMVSADSGQNWQKKIIKEPITESLKYKMTKTGGIIYIGYRDYIESVGNIAKLLKSSDNGDTWQDIDTGINTSGRDIDAIIVNGSNIYLSFGSYLIKSSDGGTSWNHSMISAFYSPQMANLYIEGGTLYVPFYDRLSESMLMASSIDDGINWNFLTIDEEAGMGSYRQQTTMVFNGSSVYITYQSGFGFGLKFNKSTDGGLTFLY